MQNNSINVTGSISNAQIQQNVSNSFQSSLFEKDNFDYERVSKLLGEISKYEPLFEQEYGELSKILSDALHNVEQSVANKEEPSKIYGFLNVIKDISLRVSSSVIATGIVSLLKCMFHNEMRHNIYQLKINKKVAN